jgi:hypothetical protein
MSRTLPVLGNSYGIVLATVGWYHSGASSGSSAGASAGVLGAGVAGRGAAGVLGCALAADARDCVFADASGRVWDVDVFGLALAGVGSGVASAVAVSGSAPAVAASGVAGFGTAPGVALLEPA